MRRFAAAALLAFTSAAPIARAQTSAQARVEPAKASLGDPLRYVVEWEGDLDVRHPDFSKTPCRLLDRPVEEPGRVTYRVACFETGSLELPLPRDAASGVGLAARPAVARVEGRVKPGEAAQLEPPKPLIESAQPRSAGLWWTLAGLLAAAALLARMRRRRATEKQAPPADRALLALRELEAGLAQLSGEAAAEAAARILRGYIEARFALRAPEMTTEEFLQAAPRAGDFPQHTRPELERFLQRCDLAKFARYRPGAEETRDLIETARVFIAATGREGSA